MTDRTAAVVAACTAVLPTSDGGVPEGVYAIENDKQVIKKAYCRVSQGLPITQRRNLDGARHQELRTWQAMVVSNSSRACRLMADRVIAALDNSRVDGHRVVVGLVTGPTEDRDDPASFRWSATIDVEIRD